MTNALYRDLAWLPPKPEDFGARCKALPSSVDASTDIGTVLRALANHALDGNDLERLAKALQRTRAQGHTLAPLTPFRLAILSNATANFLAPALAASALRHGIALEIIETDYGQVLQEALSADSQLHRAQPDAVLIAIDHRGLPLKAPAGDAEAAQAAVAASLAQIDAIRAGIHAHGKAVCIVQTLARPPESLFGSLALALPGTLRQLTDAYNRGLADAVAGGPDLLFDVAALAETVGLAAWHDPTLWNMAKLPFAADFLPLYAEHASRIVAALRGKSRRCLILDLDNTLWGGVIGDDDLEGIVIGQGDPTGEAHLSVQQTALALRERGIVLAVSSKNTDEVARQPFRRHPEMLLKEEHFAVFQANWNDKATNIKAIAEELSLGLDAMVFLDDNPVERGLVRQLLPQVAVPELPPDPAHYVRTLLAGGYFEAVAYLPEDRQRADFYQDNARRVALMQQAGDVDAYLASLDMHITFAPFDDIGRSRITQLINKSNQFNLTTRRYTEAEVLEVQRDPHCFGLQIRLSDTFGDNGMISVLICRRSDNTWDIDTWLMSCRVLNRKVEQAVLMELLEQARAAGIARIVGRYLPTERNALVQDHYSKLGFALLETQADGATRWELDVAAAPQYQVPMTVHRTSGHNPAEA
ncbi:MAG: HAD family hydrolase [Burkholderiaceae bacterium]|nr:HAD family hydrolase [Burkholderiaceae bacterium]